MDMSGYPILEIRMQGMQHSILSALHDHQKEIEAEVERQFEQVVKAESIERMVREAIQPVLKGMLTEAMTNAVHKAMWSQDVKSILETDVHAALLKVLREYYPGSEPEV